MKIKNIGLLCILVIGFLGCANLYTDLDKFQKERKKDGKSYFYDKEFSFVDLKVQSFMSKCYGDGNRNITTSISGNPVNMKTVVPKFGKKAISNGVLYYTSISSKYYTLGVEIIKKKLNRTEVNMFSNNFISSKNFSNINDYINDKTLKCPL